MREALDAVRRHLNRAQYEAERFAVAVEQLDADVSSDTSLGMSTRYCVDFTDLYQYLSLQVPDVSADLPHREAIRDYVLTLLHNSLNPPLILLPQYYEELRRYVLNWTQRVGHADSIRAWSEELARRVALETRRHDGLLRYLAEWKEGRRTWSGGEVEHRARVFLGRLRHLTTSLPLLHKIGGFSARFDALYRQRALQGLEEVLGESGEDLVLPRDDEVYLNAMEWLSKKRLDRDVQNETDALAVATVCELNRRLGGDRRAFVLASSAPTMAGLVTHIQETVFAGKRRALEVRDLAYWSLWFAIVNRQAGASQPPTEHIKTLRQVLLPVVIDLRREFADVRRRLDSGEVEEKRAADLAWRVHDLLNRIYSTISRFSQPDLGVRWYLDMVANSLGPLDGGTADVSRVLNSIHHAVGELVSLPMDASDVATRLLSLATELESVLSELFGAESIDIAAERFERGVVASTSEILSRLDEKLELEGRSGVQEVLTTIGKLASRSPATLVLEARAQLLMGNRRRAEELIGSIREGDLPEALAIMRARLWEASGDYTRMLSELSGVGGGGAWVEYLSALARVRLAIRGDVSVVNASQALVAAVESSAESNVVLRARVTALGAELHQAVGPLPSNIVGRLCAVATNVLGRTRSGPERYRVLAAEVERSRSALGCDQAERRPA